MFDGDDNMIGGSAAFVVSNGGRWAFSSTGNFHEREAYNNLYSVANSSILSMPNPELYTTARVSPLSLRYYGLCLWNGRYTAKLHFAEIVITDNQSLSSLGNRVFDVYIQVRGE